MYIYFLLLNLSLIIMFSSNMNIRFDFSLDALRSPSLGFYVLLMVSLSVFLFGFILTGTISASCNNLPLQITEVLSCCFNRPFCTLTSFLFFWANSDSEVVSPNILLILAIIFLK